MDSKHQNKKKKPGLSIFTISKVHSWLKRAKNAVWVRKILDGRSSRLVVHKAKRSHSLPTTPYILDLEYKLKSSFEENPEGALTEAHLKKYRSSLLKYFYSKDCQSNNNGQ